MHLEVHPVLIICTVGWTPPPISRFVDGRECRIESGKDTYPG